MNTTLSRQIPALSFSGPFGWAFLFLLPFLVFAQSLSLPFLFLDDAAYFSMNPVTKDGDARGLLDMWTRFSFGYTPITHLTIWIDERLGFAGTWFPRLHSILWFSLSACGVRAFMAKLTGSDRLGYAVAVLYAVHPVCAITCLWLALRRQAVSLGFLWWSLYFFMRALETPGTRQPLFLAASSLLAAGAMLGRFQGVVVAPIALAIVIHRQISVRQAVTLLLPLSLITFAFTAISIAMADSSSLGAQRLGGSLVGTVASDGAILLRYLAMTVWPWNLTAYYSVVESSGFGFQEILNWTLLPGIAATTIAISFNKRLASLLWLMALAALLPALNIINQNFAMADHYLQPAIPFLLVILILISGDIFKRFPLIPLRPIWTTCLLLVVCLLFASGSWVRIAHFTSTLTFLHQAVKASPTAGFWWAFLSRTVKTSSDKDLQAQCIPLTGIAVAQKDVVRVETMTLFKVLFDWAWHLERTGTDSTTFTESYRPILGKTIDVLQAMIHVSCKRDATAIKIIEPMLEPANREFIEKTWNKYQQGRTLPSIKIKIDIKENIWGITDALDQSQVHRIWQVTALVALAEAHLHNGNPEMAAKIALATLHRIPNEKQSWLLLSEALSALGQAEQSVEAGKRAIAVEDY